MLFAMFTIRPNKTQRRASLRTVKKWLLYVVCFVEDKDWSQWHLPPSPFPPHFRVVLYYLPSSIHQNHRKPPSYEILVWV